MKVKYTGLLARPMPYPYSSSPGPLATEEQVQAWVKERAAASVAAWRERMDALFDFHGVKRGNWNMLAGTLAEFHVPGFSEEKAPRGAKTKWDQNKRAELKIVIDDHIRSALPRKISITAAIGIIRRHEPWKSEVSSSSNPVAALRKQYDLADPRWVRVVRGAMAWRLHEENPDMPLSEVNRLTGFDPS